MSANQLVGESTCGRTDPAVLVLWNASVIPSIFKVICTRNINYVLLMNGKPMLETMSRTISCSDRVEFHPGQYHEIEMRMLVGKLE